MKHSAWICIAAAGAALVAACDSSVTDSETTSGSGGGTTTSVGGGTVGADLPCEVADVLANCSACHATPKPSGGVSLRSRDDLLAAAPSDPSVTVADRALARMQDSTNPMPPTGQLAAADIATFEGWISDGMPAGGCDGPPPPETVCTSDSYWTQGDEGSRDMYPGRACITCHEAPGPGEHGPPLLFGGTVYPTVHEPDDCNGGGPTVQGSVVVVTDANGVEHSATVRSNGNFLIESEANLATPIHAEVRRDGKVNKMKDPVDSGDCNSCHTVDGANDAPGRILAP